MPKSLVPFFALALTACGAEPTQPSDTGKSGEPAKPTAEPTTAAPPIAAESGAANPDAVDSGSPTPTEPAPVVPAIPEAPPGEVAINPWSAIPHTRTWTLAAEPTEPLSFAPELSAGVLARSGTSWQQLGEAGQLVAAEMDVEPKAAIQGVWPSDAWWIDSRTVHEGEESEYIEVRLMKLRAGNRWVPQEYNGDQWFHPGTDGALDQRASTLSGMLVISGFDNITRIAGKHPDPVVGPHRGEVVEILESGSGKVYVLSTDAGLFAQIECDAEDPDCVSANAKKLPVSGCNFGRQVARGRHSVSMGMTCGEREFILHHRGKSDGWLLDELPAGGKPSGMWASEEGGLWTLTGEQLRWRDTESVWHDVGLPEGLTGTSVAVTEDRKQLWVAGVVGGAAKVFTTDANAVEVAAPAP